MNKIKILKVFFYNFKNLKMNKTKIILKVKIFFKNNEILKFWIRGPTTICHIYNGGGLFIF